MKYLIVIITCLFYITPIMAQDSLLSNKKAQKWCLSFNIDNNYNYRYAKNPIFGYSGYHPNYDKTQAAKDYLDTCNIACTMKSFSIKFEWKVWKFIGLQSGLILGRKGYMGCRNVAFNGIGISRLYYTNMPLTTIALPLCLVFSKSALKNKLFFSTNTGLEVNFNVKEYDSSDRKGNIEYEKQGFFGFRSLKNIDNKIPYEPDEQGILGFPQYHIGFNIKYIIFNSTYFFADYSYISDFKFYTVREYFDLKTYEYERKSYIHRYGGGIGFMF